MSYTHTHHNLECRGLHRARPEREVYRDYLQDLNDEAFDAQVDHLVSGLLVIAGILGGVLALVNLFRWWLS